LYIRLKIAETPAFKAMQAAGAIVAFPVVEVLRHYPKQVLCTTALYLGGITVPFYTVWVFLVYYATTTLKVDRSAVLLGVVVTNLILLSATIAGGIVSDRAGRRPSYLAGVALLAILAFPFFWVADLAQPKWIWLAMLVFAAPLWWVWGVLPALFAELFPPQLRYTGISIGSQAATIIGGFVPLFATAVVAKIGTWPVSTLIVVCELLAIIALFVLRPRATPAPFLDVSRSPQATP
jgi:MFS transporter, MHS family, shikimate and dehydroshikimate transport protein